MLENYSASNASCETMLAELYQSLVHSELIQKEFRSVHSLSNAFTEVKRSYFEKVICFLVYRLTPQALGPAKYEVSSKYLTQKISEAFIQFFDQIAQQHQVCFAFLWILILRLVWTSRNLSKES